MALTGAPVIGKACKLYYDADGDIATPTWVEIGKVQNVDVDWSRDEAEIKERDQDEATVMLGHKVRSITVEITRRPDNAVYDAIEAAAEAGTKIGLAAYTGAIATAGNRGWAGEVFVTAATDPQAHTGSTRTFTFRPAASYVTAPLFAETA